MTYAGPRVMGPITLTISRRSSDLLRASPAAPGNALPRRTSCDLELCEPPPQEVPLPLVLHEVKCQPVGNCSFGRPSESAKEIGSGGRKRVIPTQSPNFYGIERRKTDLGAIPHGYSYRPVQLNHWRRGDQEKQLVERHDLFPIGRSDVGRLCVNGGDGCLQDVGALGDVGPGRTQRARCPLRCSRRPTARGLGTRGRPTPHQRLHAQNGGRRPARTKPTSRSLPIQRAGADSGSGRGVWTLR